MKAEYPNRIPTGIILSNGPTTHNTYVLKEVCDIHSPFPEYVRCSNYLQHLQTCVQLWHAYCSKTFWSSNLFILLEDSE
jgi:hypothetical protein